MHFKTVASTLGLPHLGGSVAKRSFKSCRILPELEEAGLPVVPELPEISFELPLDKSAITLAYVRRYS